MLKSKYRKRGGNMYLRILKNDLKRKKTMNIILLLFVILSVMFVSSSVNNIVTVMNGLDYYFEKAGMADYYFINMDKDGTDPLIDILDNEASVKDYRRERMLSCTADNFTLNGKKTLDFSNAAIVLSVDEAQINYFDSDNEIIDSVEQGKVYITRSIADRYGLEVGDTLEFRINDTAVTMEFAGGAKDAFLGSEMMANPRFIMNDDDYRKICSDSAASDYMGSVYYVDTDDVAALEASAAGVDNTLFSGDNALIKTTYIMNMLVAGILLIVSVCLILVSFVVLRFTIGFTISEEFREIGVMKAVGIRNRSIRSMYCVKYLGISAVGAVIGYAASVPFGNMMLSSVSKNMVLGNENSFIIGILCSIAVVGIILLFCYGCTRKIKKMSPIDAVRSGQTGERFHKRSIMSLGKSRLGATGFMSLNDILSSPKQYGIITAVFTVCILLVMLLANTANTLNSEKLLFLFGTTESDVYYTDAAKIMDVMTGTKSIDDVNAEIEHMLEENGMPGKVHVEAQYKLPVEFGDTKLNVVFQHCKDTNASEYTYSKGSAPKYSNEIALTEPIAEKLGADIGDTVKLTVNGEEGDYIVTALFQSFNQLGEVGRLHEDIELSESNMSGSMSFQIDFDDDPDAETIGERIEKLKDISDTDKVFDVSGFVKDCTGASDIVAGVKNLVLTITVIIIVLICVLMERSFITKEKAEIALMKAMGFKSGTVVLHHTLRFGIVALFAGLLAAALCIPLTKLAIDPIFAMMGAVKGVGYKIEPLEIFAVYPLTALAVTALGAFFTSLYTKTIKASDTSNIE